MWYVLKDTVNAFLLRVKSLKNNSSFRRKMKKKNRKFSNIGVCTKQTIPLFAQSFVSGQICRFYYVNRLTLGDISGFRVK